MSSLPKLFHKSSKGVLYEWQIFYSGDSYRTVHGQVGGQLVHSDSTICKPTNVGQKNERDSVAQCKFEVDAMQVKKLGQKYRLTVAETDEACTLPMLAKDFHKYKGVIDFTKVTYTQPKFDGVRCRAYWDGDEVKLMSRLNKPYNVPHISKQLEHVLPKGDEYDGELYIHNMAFPDLIALIKKYREGSELIEYHIYDKPIHEGKRDLTFTERHAALVYELGEKIQDEPTIDKLIGVVTSVVTSPQEVIWAARRFVADGYEGAMVRKGSNIYKWGGRSDELLKAKFFIDAEFLVTGAEEGVGKMSGCVTWLCATKDGKTFKATPKCSLADRANYWKNRSEYIGKYLTVTFFEYSDDGIPRFPVGKAFRDEADLPNPEEDKDE